MLMYTVLIANTVLFGGGLGGVEVRKKQLVWGCTSTFRHNNFASLFKFLWYDKLLMLHPQVHYRFAHFWLEALGENLNLQCIYY